MNEYEKAYLRSLLQPLPVTPTADVMRFVNKMNAKWWIYGSIYGSVGTVIIRAVIDYARAS